MNRCTRETVTDRAGLLLEKAIAERLFPGAVASLFSHEGILTSWCAGRFHYGIWARRVSGEALYDLASLTKPLVTALCLMKLYGSGALDLDDPVHSFFANAPELPVTIRHLLTHCSGLPAHQDLRILCDGQDCIDQASLVDFLFGLLQQGTPERQSCYSDLGFILLGLLVQEVSGQPLDHYFASEILPYFYHRSGVKGSALAWSPVDAGHEPVPSGWCPVRERMLQGEVHDLNAFLLGGVAGHAGLFGSLFAVTGLLSQLLSLYLAGSASGINRHDGSAPAPPFSQETLKEFWTPGSVKGSRWALGFDLPSEKGSAAGDLFSPGSVGHLGYTGTSFWIDLSKGIGVLLLTNRTFPLDTAPSRRKMHRFRREFHNAVMEPFS